MLSILIGHSYFQRFDRKQVERAKPYPPLATLQVAALLRGQGRRVAFFDAMLAQGPEAFEAQLGLERPALVLFYEDNYNFLTKMCLGRMREACLTMIGRARAQGARVIAAGSDVSDTPGVYLRAGADVVLRGEGLEELQALLTRLDAQPDAPAAQLADGLGAAGWAHNGAVRWGDAGGQPVRVRTPASAHASIQAEAAWDLVDMPTYRAVWTQAHGRFSLNMAASKGCSFRCAWCAKPIWGQRYLQRAPEAVAAEMLALKQRAAPDHVWFADDIFGFRADWVRRFADVLAQGGGGVPFTIQTRADLVSDAMADALAQAGCAEAWIGAESGSQQVLDAMDKGTTVDEIEQTRERLRARGVRVGFFIQLGYLGEDLDELLATRALIERAQPDDIGVSVAYPLPGTRFYEQVREQLGAKTHWDDSADLAMMFRGTFSSEFYRGFRDLLHEEVRIATARAANGQRLAWEALQQRWNTLIAAAPEHRTATVVPAT